MGACTVLEPETGGGGEEEREGEVVEEEGKVVVEGETGNRGDRHSPQAEELCACTGNFD